MIIKVATLKMRALAHTVPDLERQVILRGKTKVTST